MNSPHRLPAESSGSDEIDLNELVYTFDVTRPWHYFKLGYPVASSVEKGRKTLKNSRLMRIYVPKRKKPTWRKNAPFKALDQINFTCCDRGCLLKEGINRTKVIIREQRNMVHRKPYNEQNYLFSKLMEVTLTFRGVRKIRYHVPKLGKVCKTAFRKVYGISKSKIEVLLNKIDLRGPSVEPDKRGQKTPRKLLPAARNAVIDFILSYKATESHYRKSRTRCKKYFNSNISMRQMWSEFVRLHPRLQTTSLRKRNKGPVISFSAFRNVFNSNLKDVLSFRKARLDTCQVCDKTMNRMGHLMALRKRTLSQDDELQDLKSFKSAHLRESEIRFASLKYDVTVLASKV